MGDIIPFRPRGPAGSWAADFRVHSRDTCTKVKRQIACEACGYPREPGKALFASEEEYKAFERDMRHARIFDYDDFF